VKSKKKPKRPKPRIKVAPPSKKHKSKKDYDRRSLKAKTKEALDSVSLSHNNIVDGDGVARYIPQIEFTDHLVHNGELSIVQTCVGLETESPECQKIANSWVDYFFAIFGFKRKK